MTLDIAAGTMTKEEESRAIVVVTAPIRHAIIPPKEEREKMAKRLMQRIFKPRKEADDQFLPEGEDTDV